jgi:hypothetical protein
MEGRVIRGMRDRTKGGEMKKNTGKITAEICETRQGEKNAQKVYSSLHMGGFCRM